MNQFYTNPILAGDYPDPSVIRVGYDYYMTHSSCNYSPGLLIWHSRNLVHWRPLCYGVREYIGDIWAPDLVFYKGKFFIYFEASGKNWVITAPCAEGPWSNPVDIGVDGLIDPGHFVDDSGKRYLYFSFGHVVELSEDGLSAIGTVKKCYDGWKYPDEWVVEGFYLESPKITCRNGYYYMTAAQGGTAGPATSHMVVSSRSKNPFGPWEHSPYNPIVHTTDESEKWWSKGHGTLVDTPDGEWWLVYHAYENGYRSLGRQTLMEPLEWTHDGWFKIPSDIKADKPIRIPKGEIVPHGISLSDDFKSGVLGIQWRSYCSMEESRIKFVKEGMMMSAKGRFISESSPITFIPQHHSYEVQVVLSLIGEAEGGLVLFYNPDNYCGISFWQNTISPIVRSRKTGSIVYNKEKVFLRVVNMNQNVLLYYSQNGNEWIRLEPVIEVSGYHHNVLGGFLSLRVGLFAFGHGKVVFSDFLYKAHG